ncbi:hypothetical protein SUNI508_12091 [Seiridium unicorne]|uniref:Small ribosomal subunit protein bS18m n=1 Tax=Seiridium unicorne TaxID=138068 RepID=A0ABR2UF37_9PEZI
MPPRIPILSAIRPAQTCLKTQVCQFSKTASSQGRKKLRVLRLPLSLLYTDHSILTVRDLNTPTSSSSLLDLDSPSSNQRSPSSQPGSRNRTAMAQSIFNTFRSSKASRNNQPPEGEQMKVVEELRSKAVQEDYMRQMPRRWALGDLYAPHDLSPVEMKKWRSITTVERDLVDLLGLKPLDMYRNFSFISEYTTSHGRIKRAEQTGLRPVNQRKVAKAIRRAIGLGLHPSVHKHPELLMRERRLVGQQNAPIGKIGKRYSI